jgi:asparagine synthase (glutamine-hydrolysing)
MCGIAGIISNSEDETGPKLKRMLCAMQHRGPDGVGIMIDGKMEHKRKIDEIKLLLKKGEIGLGHVRLAITGGLDGLQPFQSRNGELTLLHNGEIYNYRELKSLINTQWKTDTDSEVIIRLIEKYYKGDLEEAVKQVLPLLDGVYALVITDNNNTIIVRDKIGVKQLYYSINGQNIAFASEKKPLWAINGTDVKIERLLPGYMAVIKNNKVTNHQYWSAESLKSSNLITATDEAIKKYGDAIQHAVEKRVKGKDRVGIIFSGGIDSLLIANEVQKLRIPFTCYTVGREGARDIEWAKKIAGEFDFPLNIKILSTKEIKGLIPQIINDIEDCSLNQIEVSIPIYVAVRMAQEAGERVILTGQGPDEIFGGYPWYAKIVDQEGYQSFVNYSWDDTFLLYKECMEREDKIAMAHSIELRIPFLDPEVIRTAFEISPELKINKGNDILGKQIHRKYGISRGISKEIAYRKKEAAQHGANIHDAFTEIAKNSGLTEELMINVNYDPDITMHEKLGSSSRYGYKYGDHNLWKPLSYVQYYLDIEAAKLGILPEKIHEYLQATINKSKELKLLFSEELKCA